MATTAPNLHYLSSSSYSHPSFSLPNSSSFSFQIPFKRPHFSCCHPKSTLYANPFELNHLNSGFSNVGISQTLKSFNLFGNPGLGRDLMVAQATEVVAPTSEEPAAQSKPSKKKKNLKYPRRFLDMYQILQYPVITEAAVKNIAEENSLLFTVDVRADKTMIKDAVKNLFGVTARKVNTSIRPDGTKKAHIMLSKEYNASDLAKKIGIFPSSD